MGINKEEKLKIIQEYERIQLLLDLKDPHIFLTKHCKTLDESDSSNPYKNIPDYKYVEDLINIYHNHQLILVQKSRQMMASWITIGYLLWYAMFYKPIGTRIFVMSKKEKDADALMKRMKTMYTKLPENIKALNPCDQPFVYNKMCWEKNDTIIQGVPQGADQVRSYTANIVFMDEMSFQDKAEEAFAAVKPTLQEHSKFIGVSTPNGKEYFYRLLTDYYYNQQQKLLKR